MRRFLMLISLFLLPFLTMANPVSSAQLLQLVDYVGVDYPEAIKEGEVVNPAEYAEMQEFSNTIVTAIQALPPSAEQAVLAQKAENLQQMILEKAPSQTIQEQTRALTQGLKPLLNVPMTPSDLPNLSAGAKLYAAQCTSCHGETGQGNGPLAASLSPVPTDFTDPERVDQLNVFAFYNTLTLGVEGTGMAAYVDSLTDKERWDLAFYISTLRNNPREVQQGEAALENSEIKALFADLNQVTTTSIQALDDAPAGAKQALMYLRENPQAIQAPSGLAIAQKWLKISLEKYKAQDQAGAYQAALAAYLEGFETAEAVVDVIDHEQRIQIEKAMSAYRLVIEKQEAMPVVQAQYDSVMELLSNLEKVLPTAEFSTPAVFFSSFFILLREGMESILIVGMLIMMLTKAERRDLLPSVHLGWIFALIAGGLTWWVSRSLLHISGAAREMTEGLTALLAGGILLYVGIWVHRHHLAQNWRSFLNTQLNKYLTGEAKFGLGFLAFLAVYREAFETILFYEALTLQINTQSYQALGWGIIAAAALLVAVTLFVVRFGVRLPLQTFFKVTTAMIFLFAIVFIGQGLHALEEAGKLPMILLPLPSIEFLGIYPNVISLGIQAAIVVVAIVLGRRK